MYENQLVQKKGQEDKKSIDKTSRKKVSKSY